MFIRDSTAKIVCLLHRGLACLARHKPNVNLPLYAACRVQTRRTPLAPNVGHTRRHRYHTTRFHVLSFSTTTLGGGYLFAQEHKTETREEFHDSWENPGAL